MTRDDALKGIKEIFSKIIDYEEEVTEELEKEDVEEWDSMNHILLLSEIQKKFNVVFASGDLIKYNSVKKIIDGIMESK